MNDPNSLNDFRAAAKVQQPRAWVLIASDRTNLLAIRFLLLATVLLIVAFIVGFDLYETINVSSGVAPGLIILFSLVLWTFALVFGIMEPISGANRVMCAALHKATGATHVWPLSGDPSIEALSSSETAGGSGSSTSRKMLLAVDNETLSFWTVEQRSMTRTIVLPVSSLLDASAQTDPGAGSPLAMKICLDLRAANGGVSRVEFNPRPTTMRLLREPESLAATLRAFVSQRPTPKSA